jgi:hypothetical protein
LSLVELIAVFPMGQQAMLVRHTRRIMIFLQQRVPRRGQHRLPFKVLLPIGLWAAAVVVQGHMTKEVMVAEAEVLLQRVRML